MCTAAAITQSPTWSLPSIPHGTFTAAVQSADGGNASSVVAGVNR